MWILPMSMSIHQIVTSLLTTRYTLQTKVICSWEDRQYFISMWVHSAQRQMASVDAFRPPICQNSLLLWNRFYSQWRHFVIVQSGHLLSPSGYRGIGLVWNILPSILATFRVILSRSEWYGGPCGSLGSGGSTGFGGCGRSCTSGGSCGSSGNCLALRYAIFLEI